MTRRQVCLHALGNARHDARSQPTHIVSLASASERMGLCDVAGDDGEGAKWIARTDGSGGIRPHGEGHSSGCRCAAPMRRFETTGSVKRPPEERPYAQQRARAPFFQTPESRREARGSSGSPWARTEFTVNLPSGEFDEAKVAVGEGSAGLGRRVCVV